MTQPRIPVASYRLQFHSGMRFEDARALISYFHDLGITDLYASPILQARRGSTHGYDITDPTKLNPELGSEEDFENLIFRYEEPNGMTRWDSPLFIVVEEDETPPNDQIWEALIGSDGKTKLVFRIDL